MDGSGSALGVDVGGTFTDVVVVAGGLVVTAKTPTTADRSEGVLRGIELACDRAGIDPAAVDRFRHATTTAVNAMLEGTGAETALVTTAGFRDVLEIGRQTRPALYDLSATPIEPLVPVERRYEVDERVTPGGIEREPDDDEVDAIAGEIAADGVDAVAVCLLHAYATPANERRVADRLRAALDVPVVASHETLAEFREYERSATTVADAYVTPVVGEYLARLTERATDAGLPAPRIMQSNGGIADADTVRDRAVTTLRSGPAAGVVGATQFGKDLVTFDMGGTSTDVSLVRDDTIERTTDADVAGHPVRVPMVDVTSVGAGGGSIAWVDEGGALRVGPASAGAEPGPACYGRGGTAPTVTDAALELGLIGAGATLGAAGAVTLDGEAASAVLGSLADAADLPGPTAAAAGVVRVATASMARAVRSVTTERGHDPRHFSLAAFGGAGPMFAAALAQRLGVTRVLVPRASGVLSAMGLLAAAERHDAVRTHRTSLDDASIPTIEHAFEDLGDAVLATASEAGSATVERAVDCRYVGQAFELTVPAGSPFEPAELAEAFHSAHERAYGYRLEEPVELVNLRTRATIPGDPPTLTHDGDSRAAARSGERTVHGGWADGDAAGQSTPVFVRGALPAGTALAGPAIVAGDESTTVVPPDWTATVDDQGTLVMEVTDA